MHNLFSLVIPPVFVGFSFVTLVPSGSIFLLLFFFVMFLFPMFSVSIVLVYMCLKVLFIWVYVPPISFPSWFRFRSAFFVFHFLAAFLFSGFSPFFLTNSAVWFISIFFVTTWIFLFFFFIFPFFFLFPFFPFFLVTFFIFLILFSFIFLFSGLFLLFFFFWLFFHFMYTIPHHLPSGGWEFLFRFCTE